MPRLLVQATDLAISLRSGLQEAVIYGRQRFQWQATMNETGTSPSRLRVGIDLVSVREVARSLERFGERYVRRVFTVREAAYCRAAAGRAAAARFAVRFAAKEAALKALDPEMR